MTVLKVLAIIVVAVCATLFMFGFAAGFFDSITAGYIAGCGVIAIGTYAVFAIIIKDIRRSMKMCRGKEGDLYEQN